VCPRGEEDSIRVTFTLVGLCILALSFGRQSVRLEASFKRRVHKTS
jgi:hypothetical protein